MTDDDREISAAGYIIADLLTSSLFPPGAGWDSAKIPLIWEHNALCWLVRNRQRIKLMNAWTAMLLADGYPAKPFVDAQGKQREAGLYWNATMKPRGEDG